MKPVLIVIAGPNGAGKTTVTEHLRADRWSEGVEYINPDEIARDRFGDWNEANAIRSAADWAEKRREELLARREGIAFETVLSAPDKLDFIERAAAAGYFVRVFFVATESPTILAARVARRVMQGGHTVPIEKIVSRYAKSIANLTAIIPDADRVYVFDNTPDAADARLVVRCVEGAVRKIYGDLPNWVEEALVGIPRHAQLEDQRSSNG